MFARQSGIALLAAPATAAATAPARADDPLNNLFITIDDLGLVLGCYSWRRQTNDPLLDPEFLRTMARQGAPAASR